MNDAPLIAVVETEDFAVRHVYLRPDRAAAEKCYYALWQARMMADGYPVGSPEDDQEAIDWIIKCDYDSAEMYRLEIVEATNE